MRQIMNSNKAPCSSITRRKPPVTPSLNSSPPASIPTQSSTPCGDEPDLQNEDNEQTNTIKEGSAISNDIIVMESVLSQTKENNDDDDGTDFSLMQECLSNLEYNDVDDSSIRTTERMDASDAIKEEPILDLPHDSMLQPSTDPALSSQEWMPHQQQQQQQAVIFPPVLPNLHPTTSEWMRRVNSCYFSIASEASLENSVVDDGNFVAAAAELDEYDEDYALLFGDFGLDDGGTEEIKGDSTVMEDGNTYHGGNSKTGIEEEEEKESSKLKSVANDKDTTTTEPTTSEGSGAIAKGNKWNAGLNILYHDIMMHIFTYLSAPSLAAFSITARRPNFECFYFLQLQLQRALLVSKLHANHSLSGDHNNTTTTSQLNPTHEYYYDDPKSKQSQQKDQQENRYYQDALSSITGSGSISRLASMDQPLAERIVQEYLDSNSTLRTLPLPHSLAYLRHALSRYISNLHLEHSSGNDGGSTGSGTAAAARVAAVMVTVIGAASFMNMSASGGGGVGFATAGAGASSGTGVALGKDSIMALKHMLRVGLAGSLVKAGAAKAQSSFGGGNTSDGNGGNDDGGRNGTIEHSSGGILHMRDMVEHMAQIYYRQSNSSVDNNNNEGRNTEVEDEGVEDHFFLSFPTSIAAKLHAAFSSAYGHSPAERKCSVVHSEGGEGADMGNDTIDIDVSQDTDGGRGMNSVVSEDSNSADDDLVLSSSSNTIKRRHRSKRCHLNISKKELMGDAINCTVTKNDNNLSDCKNADSESMHGTISTTSTPSSIVSAKNQDNNERIHDNEIAALAMNYPLSPNPYEHESFVVEKDWKEDIDYATAIESSNADGSIVLYGNRKNNNNDSSSISDTNVQSSRNLKVVAKSPRLVKKPSGCVGAYTRAVHKAMQHITDKIKERRKNNFEALPEDERVSLSTAFIDACSSDDTLQIAKDILQRQNMIDVDGFYVGSDGTETCALHTAAFNGASKVLEFLCRGIDERDAENDGGLCNVDITDLNGWTALHFAAGANHVSAIRIIAEHGAKMSVEASNGYTPYHWAERLSNLEAAEELKKLGADNRFLEARWMFGQRVVVPMFLANRFFALIPSN